MKVYVYYIYNERMDSVKLYPGNSEHGAIRDAYKEAKEKGYSAKGISIIHKKEIA